MRRLLVCLVGCLAVAGCGKTKSDQMVRTGTAPVERKADGRLAVNPAPLTIANVEQAPADSPRRALMQMFFWAQWGNVPAVVDAYDSRIGARVGVSRIVGAYAQLRTELLASLPRIVSQRQSRGGQFVAVELHNAYRAPQREGFFLRRQARGWRIIYDTLLERGLENYAIVQADPGAATPSRAARRLGVRAAQRYRDISISLFGRQRVATGAGTGTGTGTGSNTGADTG